MDISSRKNQREAQTQKGNNNAIRRMQVDLARQGKTPALTLHNIRFGFATNSSSSHSIIIASGLQDNLSQIDDTLSYGWGNFTLASRLEKTRYFATAMVRHYRFKYKMGKTETSALVRSFFKEALEDINDDDLWESYIDHQSLPCFPTPRSENEGMEPYWQLLKDHIINRDDVVILGGNDNSDGHPLYGEGPISDIYQNAIAIEDESKKTFIHDKTTGHFTVFSQKCGTKIRFTPNGIPAPQSSTIPELVDLKITDYCAMGCDYCYMDSTEKGKHAKLSDLESLAYSLGRQGVFEVAIGGGEPTEHPDFINIIKSFYQNDVIPSFSTQNWKWLENPDIWGAVSNYCGAVALSTQKKEHIKPWLKACYERSINTHFHYVLGLNPLENLVDFLEEAKTRNRAETGYNPVQIVLLAYKEIGRAKGTPPNNYEGWAEVVSNHADYSMTIAIDSFLVKDVEEGVFDKLRHVSKELYENSDGKFSMYYDAVEKRAAAHSFIPIEEQLPVTSVYSTGFLSAWNNIKNG